MLSEVGLAEESPHLPLKVLHKDRGATYKVHALLLTLTAVVGLVFGTPTFGRKHFLLIGNALRFWVQFM